MKICIISNLYEPYILGGAEVYVEKITKYLAVDNEVFVITTKPYENLGSLKPSVEILYGIKIYRFYPLNIYHTYDAPKLKIPDFLKLPWHILDLWNPHSYFMIKKILDKEKPDVVHTHNLGGFSAGATFSAVKNLNLPLVHTCHDHSILCPYAVLICPFWKGELCKYPIFLCKIYLWFKRKIIHTPDIVTAPSQFVLDMHTKNGFFKDSKIAVLPSGIELKDIGFDNDSNERKNNINILYVGHVGKHKGIQVLINAFRKINKDNIKLHIVGGGNPYEKGLKDLAKNDKRIKFYSKLPNEEVQKFYRWASILVVPSICYENSPMAIYEAFNQGTPVIGSNIGGIPELIKDNYNGFLFEAGNVEKLKEILENIIENPKQLKELSKNAFESVKQYDMCKHINKLLNIYKEAIGLNPVRSADKMHK